MGRIADLAPLLARHGVGSVLLISGESTYARSGAQRHLRPLASRLRVRRFAEFSPNPDLEMVTRAVRVLRQEPFDAVVAIGGGSALDLAKAASALAAQDLDPAEYLLAARPLRPRRHLLVLVPTTAGTGSEVTPFAVLYVAGVKRSLDDPILLADHAIVDPELTASAPPRVAASAALDALSQAIESLWSVRSTVASRRHARAALRLALEHLPAAVSRPPSVGMAQAALLAGRAIAVTRTTAPHAVSYTFTSLFGVPHGHACTLTLPAFLVYNSEVSDTDLLDPRGVGWVRLRIGEILTLLGRSTPQAGGERLRRLVAGTGLAPGLSDLGIDTAAVERVLARGFDPGRAANNPRRLTREGLLEVLHSSF